MFWRESQVLYYIDNDNKKQGTVFCDRKVLGFDEAIKFSNELPIIIAVHEYQEIAEQLKKSGIYNYTWYVEGCDWTYKAIDKYLGGTSFPKLAIMGADSNTEPFLRYINMMAPKCKPYLCSDVLDENSSICDEKNHED